MFKNKVLLKNIFYSSIFPSCLLIFLFLLFKNSLSTNLSLGLLFRDISALYNIPVYASFFSTLGIFFWISTFSICLFTRNFLLKKEKINKVILSFYNYSCLLNFLLLIDDQFLLHERGGNDIYFYIFYLTLVFCLINKLRRIILKNELIYFLIAFLFFFLSIMIDVNFLNISYFSIFGTLEDIFKLFGIYYWLIFFGVISSRIIVQKNRI